MNLTGCGGAIMSSSRCDNDVPCSVSTWTSDSVGLHVDDTHLLQINILAEIGPPLKFDIIL